MRVVGARCARVQALWLGYPTTSGVPAVDYRITDSVVDPPGSEAFSTERLLRLPASYYCYEAPADAPPLVTPPVLANGYVTFGSFNSLAKLSTATLALWARVLHAVPDARLLIKAVQLGDEAVRGRTLARLAAHGLPLERVEILGRLPSVAQHLEMYARVDVSLDSYPYNGATTTCESLWMGVPVVTLAGPTHASRMGASILTAAGLGEWVTGSADEFTARCVRWCRERDALSAARRRLRGRVAASSLTAAAPFARDFEALLRAALAAS